VQLPLAPSEMRARRRWRWLGLEAQSSTTSGRPARSPGCYGPGGVVTSGGSWAVNTGSVRLLFAQSLSFGRANVDYMSRPRRPAVRSALL